MKACLNDKSVNPNTLTSHHYATCCDLANKSVNKNLAPVYAGLEADMKFSEGQIFKGNITLSGGDDGPTRSWIVISPFNKTHIHSIDDPLDLHCWSLFAAQKGIEGGYLELIGTDIDHPVMQLQRDKEKFGINDVHMGLHGETLNKMLQLLEHAVTNGLSYAPYAAGEILAFINSAIHSKKQTEAIKKLVNQHLLNMDQVAG